MLVLSRQRDESVLIGDNIRVRVVDIRGDKVRLGFEAPKEITIHREEVYLKIKEQEAADEEAAKEVLRKEDEGRALTRGAMV